MKTFTFYKVVLFFFGVSCYFGQVLVLKENLFELAINGTELFSLTVNSYYNAIDQMVEPCEISKFENNIVKRISRDVQNKSSSSFSNEVTNNNTSSSLKPNIEIADNSNTSSSLKPNIETADNSNTSSSLKPNIETEDKAQPSTGNVNINYTATSTSTINTTDLLHPYSIAINRKEQNYTNAVDTFPSTFSDQNYGNFVVVFFLSAIIVLTLGVFFIIIYKKQQGRSFYQVRRDLCLIFEESAV